MIVLLTYQPEIHGNMVVPHETQWFHLTTAADHQPLWLPVCGHVDESATGLFLSLHYKHGTGCWQSWNCCSRPLLVIDSWKHFCSSLPMDIWKHTGDCFVILPRSSAGGATRNTNTSFTVTVFNEVQIVCIWSSWCHCHSQTPLSLVNARHPYISDLNIVNWQCLLWIFSLG